MENIDFKDIYCKGRFYNFDNLYIFNQNPQYGDVMCFTVASKSLDVDRVVNILNGDSKDYYSEAKVERVTDIRLTSPTNSGKLVVRGWGHLTGRRQLHPILAEAVQDVFIEYCLNKLTGRVD